MFGRSRRPGRENRRVHTVPGGTVVWAVGDVHGQDDLFEAMVSAIETDLARTEASRRVVILLGDYIDRGLGSKRIVDRILALNETLDASGCELVLLKGNHEDLLLRFLDNSATGPAWVAVGGSETLLSYGIQPPSSNDAPGWEAASNLLLTSMPLSHLLFYEALDHHFQVGDYHFVHAGVRHGVPLDAQAPEDMLWIRDSFLRDTRAFEKMIVHGHTPGPDVYSDHRRLCLDTGGYATGLLTALRLEGTSRDVLQTRRVQGKIDIQARSLETLNAAQP